MPAALLLGYDLEQPSYRHRMRSIVEPLTVAGWQVRMERLPSGRYGVRTWERRELLRAADVTVLHQIKLSGLEARLIAALSRHRVFDLDDAIYVRKPRRLGEPAGESTWRRRKFAATCRWVDCVAAGNEVLARAARPTAAETLILPTSIDAAVYAAKGAAHAAMGAPHVAAGAAVAGARAAAMSHPAPTIVWIGSPENLVYLEMVRPALTRLTMRHPGLTLRVICSKFPDWPAVNIERIAWSSSTEAESLASAHIGVMPLTDDEWARGKCAFKLLQYMAASLPCVASPIGANTEAVVDGVTGFHARNDAEWERALNRLIESPTLRGRMGAAGHAHVVARYAMRTYQARYVALLERLAAR
jgi:glycosyltransferase involved in cell wall biosynthesis